MFQSRVHIVVVREIRAKIGLGRRCVESMVEYDQRQRALYQSMILKLLTFLEQSVHSRPLSSLVPQCPVSHRNGCELSLMEAMVRTSNGR